MKLDHASLSDVGKVRENNEDSVGSFVPEPGPVLNEKGALFVVADGMGGHRGGEVASGIAVRTINAEYYGSSEEDPGRALVAAFNRANGLILGEAMADSELFGMGTTCTAMVIRGDLAHFAHVGDSRAYLYRRGTLEQLTEDHSLVGEMVRSGILTDEDARVHPKRNVITRSLGVQDSIITDTPKSPMPVKSGDTFVLCSDGLIAYANDVDLASIVENSSPAEVCRDLVNFANERGGRDNVSVVVVTALGE